MVVLQSKLKHYPIAFLAVPCAETVHAVSEIGFAITA